MSFSIRRLVSMLARALAKILLVCVLILGGCLFMARQKTRAPYEWEIANQKIAEEDAAEARARQVLENERNAAFQTLIADVYGVETSRFIQSDILWITLPPGSDLQATCQAIANVWAHQSRKAYVCVESWRGNQRLARATVHGGHPVRP